MAWGGVGICCWCILPPMYGCGPEGCWSGPRGALPADTQTNNLDMSHYCWAAEEATHTQRNKQINVLWRGSRSRMYCRQDGTAGGPHGQPGVAKQLDGLCTGREIPCALLRCTGTHMHGWMISYAPVFSQRLIICLGKTYRFFMKEIRTPDVRLCPHLAIFFSNKRIFSKEK